MKWNSSALYELNTSENLEFPYDLYDQFNLDDINETECISEFRSEKQHILQLEEVLQIPALLKCDQRSVFTGTEGLRMLLNRLAYPKACRYSDLIYLFGRPVPVLCMITNKVMDYVNDTHHRKITIELEKRYLEPRFLTNVCRCNFSQRSR